MPRQYVCSNCGATINAELYYSNSPLAKTMRAQSLCFECVFWKDYIANPRPNTTIISGKLYSFFPIEEIIENKSSRNKRGLALALDMKTGALVYATKYEYIADVPKQFRRKFPDKYRFISPQTYTIIADRVCKECTAKGCWDRYTCYWYDKKKMEPKEPWNTIPPYHKDGDEQCDSYINKKTMYNLNNKER